MLLLHAQDLLDQQIIENGGFKPAYAPGFVSDAIKDIIDLVQQTTTKNIEISFIPEYEEKPYLFDR